MLALLRRVNKLRHIAASWQQPNHEFGLLDPFRHFEPGLATVQWVGFLQEVR